MSTRLVVVLVVSAATTAPTSAFDYKQPAPLTRSPTTQAPALTGDASAMRVIPNAAAHSGTLAQWLFSPTFRAVLINPTTTTASDFGSLTVIRNTTHAGGTPGVVNTAIRGIITAGKNVADYEWAVLGKVDNYADAGENVGGYFQGNKYGAGATWGAVSEVYEKRGAADPSTGTVTHEFDLNAVGTDAKRNRIIADFVLRRPYGFTGVRVHAYSGLRFQGEVGASRYDNLITTVPGQEVGDGLNLSHANILGSAIRLARGQTIALEASGVNSVSYSTVFGTPLLHGGLTLQSAASLGTTTGDSLTPFQAFANVGSNGDYLKTSIERVSNGSDWTSAGWVLGRNIDGTPVSTTLTFLRAGLRLDGAIGFNGAMPTGKCKLLGALPMDGSATNAVIAAAINAMRSCLITNGLAQ